MAEVTQAVTPERQTTTYSMWSAFRNCRKQCEWRYIHKLVPREVAKPLHFGGVIHEALALWYQGGDVQELIDRIYPEVAFNADQRRDWHLATAMLAGYTKRYPEEDFEVVRIEELWEGKIINPATDAPSRSFVIAGKVDAIVRRHDGYWLMEHKTTSSIDQGYLERLWGDFQTTLYLHFASQAFGFPIVGIIYNILQKVQLRQRQGETEEEYQARRVELIAKSKSGKTTAKRKMPEPNADFQARLAERYAEPEAFHREELYVSRDQIETLQYELWELTQAFLSARRRGIWYQNTDHCWQYNRPCPYWKLCRSGGSEALIETDYEVREPHEELRQDETPF